MTAPIENGHLAECSCFGGRCHGAANCKTWRCAHCGLPDAFGEYQDGWCQACWNSVAGRTTTTNTIEVTSG